jgi:hypothetical protein
MQEYAPWLTNGQTCDKRGISCEGGLRPFELYCKEAEFESYTKKRFRHGLPTKDKHKLIVKEKERITNNKDLECVKAIKIPLKGVKGSDGQTASALMKRLTISASTECDLLTQLADEEGLVLNTHEGKQLAVLRIDDYRVLRAAAALAGDPEHLLQSLRENARFQEGEEGEVVTFDDVFCSTNQAAARDRR